MPNFQFEVTLIVTAEAENEMRANKAVWSLLDRRIDGQQITIDDSSAHVEDWDIDQGVEQQEGKEQSSRVGRGRGGQTSDAGDDGNSRRGFAAMDPEKRREIARKGGEHSHGGNQSPDEQLAAMESLLTSGKLDEKGKKEVQDAINKRKGEIRESPSQSQAH